MIKSEHFKTEEALINWVNGAYDGSYRGCEPSQIISIVKDVTNGDWVIFYVEG